MINLNHLHSNCVSKSHSVELEIACSTARGLIRNGFTCEVQEPGSRGGNPTCNCRQCPVGTVSYSVEELGGDVLAARCNLCPAGGQQLMIVETLLNQ